VTSSAYIGEAPRSYGNRVSDLDQFTPAAADTVRKHADQSFVCSPYMNTDLERLESLLLGDGPSPSCNEKGTGGTGQSCGQRTLARAIGSAKLTIHLGASERIVTVDLSLAIWSPKASYGGRHL
jgi:hypothetical protein